MSKSIHQWKTFYSPRNGRVSIEACGVCGVAKGIVAPSHGCKPDAKTTGLLNGWSTKAPAAKKSPVQLKQVSTERTSTKRTSTKRSIVKKTPARRIRVAV